MSLQRPTKPSKQEVLSFLAVDHLRAHSRGTPPFASSDLLHHLVAYRDCLTACRKRITTILSCTNETTAFRVLTTVAQQNLRARCKAALVGIYRETVTVDLQAIGYVDHFRR